MTITLEEKSNKFAKLPQPVIEDGLLGCIFQDNDEYVNVCNMLNLDMFRFEPNRKIYEIVKNLVEHNILVDKITVWQEVLDRNWDDAFLTQEHVEALSNGGGSMRSKHAVKYAQALNEKYAKEKVPETFHNLYMASQDNVMSIEDGINLAQKYLLKLESLDKNSIKLSPLVYDENSLDDVLERKFRDNEITGLTTGMRSLDDALDGLLPGRLYGLIADSGVGKSKTAKQIALHNASQGKNVFFASYEMSTEELTLDLACMHAGINSNFITNTREYIEYEVAQKHYPDINTAFNKLKTRLHEAVKYVKSLPITIHEHEDPTIDNLKTAVEKYKLQHGRVDLIIVDGTDLFDTGKDIANELRRIYKKLKNMAKKFNCPILSLHQFNNELKDNKDRFPNVFNIAGGRGIRNNCDALIMIWRPETYSDLMEEKPELRGVCKFIIDKLRYKSRPKKPLDMTFDGIVFSSMFDKIKTN